MRLASMFNLRSSGGENVLKIENSIVLLVIAKQHFLLNFSLKNPLLRSQCWNMLEKAQFTVLHMLETMNETSLKGDLKCTIHG